MARLLRYMVLPREVSAFEASYLARINRIALVFFWLHVPTFALIAGVGGSSIIEALLLTTGVVVGPTVAYVAMRDRPRSVSLVFGITAMLMGGVLVYVDRGPMQIEMHFYFFVLIALCVVFANPMVILAAAVTVAGHHLVLWFVMPESVFNYQATWWAVAVHAIFVVLESVAAVFVARSFFDNVIGLEKIVGQRTVALDERNRDMALILDNVAQGFVTVGLDGTIGVERSRALGAWFGEPKPDARWWDHVGTNDQERTWTRLAFEGIAEDVMPIEATLDLLPKRTSRGGKELALEYRPIGAPPTSLLVVVTDVTDEVARRHVERAQRELVAVLEKATRDRAGFAGFMREASELVAKCCDADDLASTKRYLHTLKGNAGLFGAASITDLAHDLETEIDLHGEPMNLLQRKALQSAWLAFEARVEPLGVTQEQRTVIVARDEYDSVLDEIEDPAPSWTQRIQQWGLDATRPHLERLAEQAVLLAQRLEKANVIATVEDHGVRVDGERFQPLWAAMVHAVRNSVSHGVESSDQRESAGKPATASISLMSRMAGDALVVEIRDDGSGIDWSRVAVTAAEHGLPAATPGDLVAALFSGRISTAREVSEISGRGVGLEALRVVCRQLGGDVEIESARGVGTTVRCTVALRDPVVMRASA